MSNPASTPTGASSSAPSGGVPYIGSKISLISKSDIRYVGTLYTINPKESTVSLQNVQMLGTEGRRQPEIPARSEIFEFIIFKGSDIKDLQVCEPPPQQQTQTPTSQSTVAPNPSSQTTTASPNAMAPGAAIGRPSTQTKPNDFNENDPKLQQMKAQPNYAYNPFSGYPSYPGYGPGPNPQMFGSFAPYGYPGGYNQQFPYMNQFQQQPGQPNQQFPIRPQQPQQPPQPNQQSTATQQQTGSIGSKPPTTNAPATATTTSGSGTGTTTTVTPATSGQQQSKQTATSTSTTPSTTPATSSAQPKQSDQSQQQQPVAKQTQEQVVNKPVVEQSKQPKQSDQSQQQQPVAKQTQEQVVSKPVAESKQQTPTAPVEQDQSEQSQEEGNKPTSYAGAVKNQQQQQHYGGQRYNNNQYRNYNNNYNNNNNNNRDNRGNYGYRYNGQRNSSRGQFNRPVTAKTKFTEDFNFEVANAKFDKDKVIEEIKDHNVEGTDDVKVAPAYTKNSFFDFISCESTERLNEPEHKVDPRQRAEQRKLDVETFGKMSLNYNRGGYRGGRGGNRGGRGGYRGGRGGASQ